MGVPCPKHDLELDALGPPRPPLEGVDGSQRWVTVADLADTVSIEPARIRLEAEGIPTFVDGERMGSRSMYQVATGGIRLKVPEHLAADARIILSQTWRATVAELDIEEVEEDDPDEIRARGPHANEPVEPPSVRSSILLFLAIGLSTLAMLLFLFLQRRS